MITLRNRIKTLYQLTEVSVLCWNVFMNLSVLWERFSSEVHICPESIRQIPQRKTRFDQLSERYTQRQKGWGRGPQSPLTDARKWSPLRSVSKLYTTEDICPRKKTWGSRPCPTDIVPTTPLSSFLAFYRSRTFSLDFLISVTRFLSLM